MRDVVGVQDGRDIPIPVIGIGHLPAVRPALIRQPSHDVVSIIKGPAVRGGHVIRIAKGIVGESSGPAAHGNRLQTAACVVGKVGVQQTRCGGA